MNKKKELSIIIESLTVMKTAIDDYNLKLSIENSREDDLKDIEYLIAKYKRKHREDKSLIEKLKMKLLS